VRDVTPCKRLPKEHARFKLPVREVRASQEEGEGDISMPTHFFKWCFGDGISVVE